MVSPRRRTAKQAAVKRRIGWLSATAAAVAIAAACGHSERHFSAPGQAGASGDSTAPDASMADSAGSSGSDQHPSDAGAPSATGGIGGADASAGMGPNVDVGGAENAGPVTVRVMDRVDHHLVSGASVLLHDASGALVSEVLTGKTGMVRVDVAEGQFVSAALIKDYVLDNIPRQARMISTAFDIPPGVTVELLVDDPAVKTTTPTPKTIDVKVTVNTSIANADTFRLIQLSCAPAYSGTESTFTFVKYAGCPGETSYNAYGLIKVAGKLHAFGATYLVPFTGTSNAIVLDAANTDLASYQLNVKGVPPGTQSVSFGTGIARDKGDPFSIADFSNSDFVQLPSSNLTLGATMPGGNFARYGWHGQMRLSDSPFYLDSLFTRSGPAIPATATWSPVLDVAAFKPTFKLETSDMR